MKIMIPSYGTAIEPLPRFVLAACLPELTPALSACPSAFSARPSAEKPALAAEWHSHVFAQPGGDVVQPDGQVPTYMTRTSAVGNCAARTRIAAMGAGAKGPHPAREPEPV
jgi:hypothetical protein